MLHETFGWKSLSIIGAISLWRILFRIHAGAIKAPQVVDFLKVLERHTCQPMLIVWDGAPIHRSKLVAGHVASTNGRIMIERLRFSCPLIRRAEIGARTQSRDSRIVIMLWSASLRFHSAQ